MQNRASKLVGLRLEKHLDKLREQYKAQKDEEETKRQFYHSPDTARREGVDGGEDSSEGQMDGSMELSSHSEQTPEPSPAMNQRDRAGSDAVIMASSQPLGQKVLPEPAPKPQPPQVAPCPAAHSKVPPQANGGALANAPAYNPYPAPTQAAPPSPKQTVETLPPSPQHPAPLHVAPPIAPSVATPTSPGGGGGDKEALFAFAWYHGSIPRDEALRRLEGVGGFDG